VKSTGSLRIATVANIPIYIHWSFWLLIAWIVLSSWWLGGGRWDVVSWRLLLVAGLVLSVILHELGHAFAARAFRIPTRDITMYPFGGVASIERMPEKPYQELVIALAGPLVNVIIAGVIYLMLFMSGYNLEEVLSGLDALTISQTSASKYLSQLASLNVILAVFNLLPAFPMDGGRVLRALLAMRFSFLQSTRIAATVGQGFAVLFAFLGLLGNPVLIFIGFFVWVAASNEKQTVEQQASLHGLTARGAMMVEYPTLPAIAPLEAAIRALLASQARSFLIVGPSGEPVGTLSRDRLLSALHEKFALDTPITQVMDGRLLRVSAETPLTKVMQTLHEQDVPFVLVEESWQGRSQLIGLIDAENIAEYLLIRKARDLFAPATNSTGRFSAMLFFT